MPGSVRRIIPQHPLPPAWDGRAVAWDRWEPAVLAMICPPQREPRCECGSETPQFTARGRRDPSPERVANAAQLARIGRQNFPLVWSIYDLFATRCPDCGLIDVWDMEEDTHWTLDESDYGPTGSWAWSGGLLDALLTEGNPDALDTK